MQAGIGLTIYDSEVGIKVSRVTEGSPASELGVKVGDVIYSINHQSVEELSVEDIVPHIVGPLATTVHVVVRRGSALVTIGDVERGSLVSLLRLTAKLRQLATAVRTVHSKGQTRLISCVDECLHHNEDLLKQCAALVSRAESAELAVAVNQKIMQNLEMTVASERKRAGEADAKGERMQERVSELEMFLLAESKRVRNLEASGDHASEEREIELCALRVALVEAQKSRSLLLQKLELAATADETELLSIEREREIEILRPEVRRLTSENLHLSNTLQRVTNDLDRLTNAHELLSSQITKEQTGHVAALSENENLKIENENLKKSLAELDEAARKLRMDLQATRENEFQCLETENEIRAWRLVVEEARRSAAGAGGIFDELSSNLRSMGEETEKEKYFNEILKLNLSDVNERLSRAIEEREGARRGTVEGAEMAGKAASLFDQLNILLIAEHAASEEQKREVQFLSEKHSLFENEIRALESKLKLVSEELSSAVDSTHSSTTELQTALTANVILTAENNSMKSRQSQFEIQSHLSANLNGQISNLQSRIDTLSFQLSEKCSEIDRAAVREAELAAEVARLAAGKMDQDVLADSASRVDGLQEDLRAVQSERDFLFENMALVSHENSSLKNTIALLETALETTQSQTQSENTSQLKNRIAALESMLMSLTERDTHIRQTLATADSHLTFIGDLLADRAECASDENAMNEMRAQIKFLESQNEYLQQAATGEQRITKLLEEVREARRNGSSPFKSSPSPSPSPSRHLSPLASPTTEEIADPVLLNILKSRLLLSEGSQEILKNNFDAALPALNSAVEKISKFYPTSSVAKELLCECLSVRGDCNLKIKNFAAALADFDSARSLLDSCPARLRNGSAHCLFQNFKFSECLNILVDSNPENLNLNHTDEILIPTPPADDFISHVCRDLAKHILLSLKEVEFLRGFDGEGTATAKFLFLVLLAWAYIRTENFESALSLLLLATLPPSPSLSPLLSRLLSHAAALSPKQLDDKHAFHFICRSANAPLLNFILNFKKIAVDLPDACGDSPLLISVGRGDASSVKILTAFGADPNTQNSNKESALCLAVRQGNVEIVTALVSAGASVNLDRSLVHMAVEKNPEILRRLVSAGAIVNLPDQYGVYPIHVAAKTGCENILKIIGGVIDDVNVRDSEKSTALHLASAGPASVSFSFSLLSLSANPNLTDTDGLSPLHLAVRAGRISNVKCLLGNSANPNLQDNYGDTALHEATDGEIANSLISARAIVDSPNHHGDTALHASALGGRLTVMRVLLESRANPDVQNLNGDRALHNVSSVPAAELLLSHRAAVDGKNKFGKSALRKAIERGFRDVAALLRRESNNLSELTGTSIASVGTEEPSRFLDDSFQFED